MISTEGRADAAFTVGTMTMDAYHEIDGMTFSDALLYAKNYILNIRQSKD